MTKQKQEWEERFSNFYWEQGEYINRKLGYNEWKNFISQEIEKAYQKGKEKTLEEVETVIREVDLVGDVYLPTDDHDYISRNDLLQTLNKMKEE